MAFTGIGGFGAGDIVAYLGVGNVQQFRSQLSEADKLVKDSSDKMNKAISAVALAGAAMFVGSIKAASDFESSFAGVVKTTDGLSDNFGNLNAAGLAMASAFRELALTVPISVNELNRIGELGGQLGIASTDLISFSDTIARMVVSTNLSIESASTEMARFVNITKSVAPEGLTAAQQIERIGSTIVELGNNFATTESEILLFAQRLAGAGSQIGLSQPDILALAATLSSVGLNAEAGGTAFSKLFMELANNVDTGGANLQKFADIAGISTDKFVKLFKEDAAEAIRLFVSGLLNIKISGGSTFKAIDDLGMSETRLQNSLLLASSASDLMTKALNTSDGAYRENIALVNESNKRFNTFESQLKLVKNALNDAFISLGQNFLPTLKSMLDKINENPEAFKTFVTTFASLAITLGAAATAIKGVQAIEGLLKLKWGPAALAITGVALAISALNSALEASRERKLKDLIGTDDLDELYTKLGSLNQELERALSYATTSGGQVKGMILENLFGLAANPANSIADISEEIKTVKDKIAELEGVTDTAAPSMDILARTLGNASDNAESLSNNSKSIKDNFVELREPIETGYRHLNWFGDSVKDVSDKWESQIKLYPEVNGGLEASDKIIVASKPNWAEYSQTLFDVTSNMFDFGDAGEAIKSSLNLAGTTVKQFEDASKALRENGIDPSVASFKQWIQAGIDPVSLGLMALDVVLKIIGDTNGSAKLVNREIKEMSDTLGAMYQPTLDLKEALESLDGELDSNLIDSLLETQERLADMLDYMSRLPGNIAESSEMYKRMTEQLKMTNEEIERLTAPFTQMTEYDKGIETLGYLIGEYQKFIALFGENVDTSAIEVLVREQINKLEAMRSGLDPTSEAYKELSRQIENADNVLAGITPTIDDNVKATEKGTAAVKTWNQTWKDFAKTFDEQISGQFSEFDEFMSSADQAKNLMDRLKYFRIDLDTTGADESIQQLMSRWAAYLQTLDRNSPAFREGLAAFQELRQQFMGLSAGSADAGSQANEFGRDMQGLVSPTNDVVTNTNDLADALDSTTPDIEEQAEAVKELADALHNQNYEVDKLNFNYKDLDTYFGNVTNQYEEYWKAFGNIKEGKYVEAGFGELFAMLDKLILFNIKFEESNADEEIGQYILQIQRFMETLDPQSEAYQKMSDALGMFIARFQEMGGVIPDAADAADDMSGILDDYADDLAAAAGATLDPPISDAFVAQKDNTLAYLKNEFDKFVGDSVAPFKASIEKGFSIFNGETVESEAVLFGIRAFRDGFDDIGESVKLVNDYLDAMALKILGMPILPPVSGVTGYHSGGLVTAHNGYLSSSDEVIAKLQRGEVVLNRQVVNNMGTSEAMRLNREGGRQRTHPANQTNVNVIVKEPGPRTNVEIAESVYPVIQYKQRNYEPGRNPYKQ